MKAMILAAGLGTRLLPLTANTPKALIEVQGRSLLEIAIRKISASGIRDIVVNVHHHAGMVRHYLEKLQVPGVTIRISDETGLLLDTGGALLHAKQFLDGPEPFLVHNVDVISDIDLQSLFRDHGSRGGLATLAVTKRPASRYFLFDGHGRLCGWKDVKNLVTRRTQNAPENPEQFAFSGIHVISPEIFSLFIETGKFSIVDAYLRLADAHPIYAYDHSGGTWFDLGKAGQIAAISDYIRIHPEIAGI